MHHSPDEIEAHYCTSPFVKEICVIGTHGVVVPDMALMRRRKIVNVGDLLRFEMEGLSHLLPVHTRILTHEIWFEPLPRTAEKINRREVERRVRDRRPPPIDHAWLNQPHVAAALPLIQARARGNALVWPEANLEIDLGLDSMERVELLIDVEHRFGVKVAAADILTVRQLIDSVRSAEAPR